MALLVVLLAALLGGCGGGGDDTTPPAATSSTTPSTTHPSPEPSPTDEAPDDEAPPPGTAIPGEGLSAEQAEALQDAVDGGAQPWRTDVAAVAAAFVARELLWDDADVALADPHTAEVTSPADGRIVALELRQPVREGDGGGSSPHRSGAQRPYAPPWANFCFARRVSPATL
ncbi:hypothetical protein [Geodermatophilus sp. SYSU D00710]